MSIDLAFWKRFSHKLDRGENESKNRASTYSDEDNSDIFAAII
jgi:hypothetical protein